MKKYQAEQYVFDRTPERSWFIVTLCEDTGTVDIQSDYGDWQHRWGKPGLGAYSLKEFLARNRTSFSYFETKFGYSSSGREGAGSWFDCDATTELIKEAIKRKFEGQEIPDNWSLEIDELESIDAKTANEYYHQIPDLILEELYPDAYDIPFVTTTHPSLRMFIEKCWPDFIKCLKEEYDKNKP